MTANYRYSTGVNREERLPFRVGNDTCQHITECYLKETHGLDNAIYVHNEAATAQGSASVSWRIVGKQILSFYESYKS
jgi:hypothetical protein